MTRRRRIAQADKIIRNVVHVFCLLMFLQLKGYYANANNPVLLYSTTYDIRLANTSKLPKIDTVTKGLGQGSAVEFLYNKSLICWLDQNAELIQCSKYNGTHTGDKMKIVSEGIITPTGMAIDWYTGNLYWTDGETKRIEVVSIENKCRRVLFWTEVDFARAIAVVPTHGLLFWTDWGEVPKIERAGMDADPATRKVIVKVDIMWPNGITVDYNTNLIYWVDAKLQFVDVMDFHGNNRKRIIKEGLLYPYALTFFDEKLYWTDWKTLHIYTWNMTSNGPIKELINGSGTDVPVDIKVFDERRQTAVAEHPCSNHTCSHLCLLSPNEPGYVCSCPTGVKLMAGSNTTCYSGFQTFLLVAQRSLILKISLDSPDYTTFTVPVKDLKNALTVDFDPKTEFIYWADRMSGNISRARLDGGEQAAVLHVSGAPDSIALDPHARNLYWTDPGEDTISVARLDGSYKKILIHEELYEPRALALHPAGGLMFWSDWNHKFPKIERAALDGSGRALVVSERVVWPNGLALDTRAGTLYWCDARTHKIEVCNMDGSGRRELHSSHILRIYGLALLGAHVYWTDTQRRTLERVDRAGGARECLVDQAANMMGMKAVRLGDAGDGGRCAGDNGGCSHFCFNRPEDYVCGCPLGLELDDSRKTCVEPDAFLVYSRKNVIGRVSVHNDHNDAVLPIKDIKEVGALAVHVSGAKIYWSDTKLKTISRCALDGSGVERVLEGLGQVEGLAVDWSAQNLYWTDAAAQRIEVARLDGSSRRALVWQALKRPRSLVLDPRRGYMYWTELGSKSIKRAAMDGSGVLTLLEQVGRAHALALDAERRTLFWAALDPPALERAHADGTGRTLLASDVTMPYALATHAGRLYWGDWNTGVVESMAAEGGARRRVHGALDYIGALAAWRRARDPPTQCGADNGGCERLCLPLPADFRCACPAHARPNPDNLTCTDPEEYLLYATKSSVGRIMVANGECTDAAVPVSGLKNVRAIEYDPVNKHLYWMDDDSHAIRRVAVAYASTSAADGAVVVGGLARAHHMALDAVGRALYWTCWDRDSINATSIDGNSSGVIVQGDNMLPRLLAFHQTKRILFWSDAGLGGLYRTDAGGAGRAELARAANVSALALDAASGALYWAAGRQILAVDIDGANRRVVWQGGAAQALAAHGGALYLCGERALMRLPLHRRDAPAAPVPHVARVAAAVAVRRVAREHPCFGGGGCGAAGACGAGGACGCGVACARDACPRRHFRCEPSRTCIPMEWKCDGQADCPDGSDESACDACGAGLRCADGRCAAALGGCDAGAPCERAPLPDAFRCDERLCLAPRLLCDGRAHCDDGSDEAPAACGYARKEQNGPPTSGKQWTALGVCVAAGGAGAAAAAAWSALRRRRRRTPPLRALPLVKPLAVRVPPSMHSSDATGSASASDSLCGYPRPTANPPPSPATASGGRRRARPARAATRPPPPTPASTDHDHSDAERAPAPPPSPAPLLY